MADEAAAAADPGTGSTEPQRLIVVSNRLPISMKRNENGEWEFARSSGGLVAAITGMKMKMPWVWVGWPGAAVPEEEQELVRSRLLNELNCVPVFLPEDTAAGFYAGFSNNVLWNLSHYTPVKFNYSSEEWDAYCDANSMFADVICNLYRPGDLTWVHDYQLTLVNWFLRHRIPTAKIGFFLHIPFPSSEVYRVLPSRKAVLLGILNADLVGFHTFDYARHFTTVVSRLLEDVQVSSSGIHIDDRIVAVAPFPIGIEPEKFLGFLELDSVKARVAELQEKFKGQHVLVGVDRLDYIKGLPHKLMGLEMFFEQHPEMVGQVTMIQLAVPSREDVEEYVNLRLEVEQLVGRINGRFGTFDHVPVHYLYTKVTPQELTALYRIADVCLVTSIRDGMNLVSLEYVVCQKDRHGVLVLSEFAGAAQSLSGALMHNPWNTEELAGVIHQAITMPEEQKEASHKRLFNFVMKHTSSFWGDQFLAELIRTTSTSFDVVPRLDTAAVSAAYAKAKRRLFICDYDGILVPLQKQPDMATPTEALLSILRKLTSDPANEVWVVSGRKRSDIQGYLGDIKCGLVAEHCYLRRSGETEWQSLHAGPVDMSWAPNVEQVLQHFTERTPGSWIETKELSRTWHYRNADLDFGSWQAKELVLQLATTTGKHPISVVTENRALSVLPRFANKRNVVRRILGECPDADFLFIGDTHPTDDMQSLEKMFPEAAFPVAVGSGMVAGMSAYIRYSVDTVAALLSTLARLSGSDVDLSGSNNHTPSHLHIRSPMLVPTSPRSPRLALQPSISAPASALGVSLHLNNDNPGGSGTASGTSPAREPKSS